MMRSTTRIALAAAFFLFGMLPSSATATSISIAVASNFAPAIRDIAAQFEVRSGQSVRIISASTGKLYAQIINGAPFDALFAADAERPQLLEAAGQGVAGSRFTYAIGRLVLWSRNPALNESNCRTQLENLGQQRLAIANPAIAPYGMAAKETLMSLDLWGRVESQLVVGENIAQTLQFVSSGNAILGFIAGTQTLDARLPQATCHWPVPRELHLPIEQQAILLQRAANNSVVANFMAFLRSSAGRIIIERHGYALPN
ncbi:MAG TPA: molybdate ABC transporter substrate-binding protein [Gammaproteobacteria bacterium]|jgi:molybdate transport system substrate-binding protein|nr:molybdate ABC transporter substrate-binding protein [Gammaproteobacteria bacterium]MDP7154663.1 molybdate ABC transporter substrate-binding protein [Gammaproteobacteria bacterium]HJP37664.1 molybdate ABC transporter substrate-binding protein [Gammaproteobacteria bacterium]